jgi:hypothetical protein
MQQHGMYKKLHGAHNARNQQSQQPKKKLCTMSKKQT